MSEHVIPEITACKSGGDYWYSVHDNKTLWDTCKRSDWWLWLLKNSNYDNDAKLRKFACECVRRTPFGGKRAWSLIDYFPLKGVVISTEQYLEGKCTEEELRESQIVAWASPPTKYHFELFVPFVAELSAKAILVAEYVSWEMALASGDLRRGLDYQTDFLKEIIGYEDMDRCATYIRESNIRVPTIRDEL